jgi:hypothetical protein
MWVRHDRPARYRRGLLMFKEQRATTPDLFKVCRRHFSQAVASVASELLFWSQCGRLLWLVFVRNRDGVTWCGFEEKDTAQ